MTYARFEADVGGTPRLLERQTVALEESTFKPSALGVEVKDRAALAASVARLRDSLSSPVDKASLVLPDSWLRMTFLESEEELPGSAAARLEVLRWKLSRLLPFKVETLRLDAHGVDSLPGQPEAERTLVGFGGESLLQAIEDAFSESRIELGCITNRSSGLLLALAELLRPARLGALVVVDPRHYTLVATRNGGPVLYRHKAIENGEASGVLRDLRLTRGFLADRGLGDQFESLELVAVPEQRTQWQGWLAESLGREARFHEFESTVGTGDLSSITGAMVGVFGQEIA